jgi:hypothetical protein
MKEITRRLYRNPIMLGAAVLLGMTLLVGSFVTAKSSAARTYIQAGDDRFETTDNGETYHNFQGDPIDPGFFNTDGLSTSEAYAGLVPLEGSPLPGQGDVDTIVHRNQDVNVPGTTTIEMTGLSLVSINPIIVTYTDRPPEEWEVRVGLSDIKASTGTMSIGDGGTFDSSLGVWPKFTFTRLSDGEVKELDTGGSSGLAAAVQGDDNVGSLPTVIIEPGPSPVPAPCFQVIAQEKAADVEADAVATSAATSSCPPVTLTSTNNPWVICAGGGFCIPRPITEQEILASHFASPPGTKRARIR